MLGRQTNLFKPDESYTLSKVMHEHTLKKGNDTNELYNIICFKPVNKNRFIYTKGLSAAYISEAFNRNILHISALKIF